MSETLWMVWGEDASEIQKYEFETQAEVNAFLFGVAESDGWLDSASFGSEAEATAYQKEVCDEEYEQGDEEADDEDESKEGDDAMEAIDDEEEIVLARLENRNGGRLPNLSMPELIEWVARMFGPNDPDVEELAELEAEKDALREIRFEPDDEGYEDDLNEFVEAELGTECEGNDE